MSMFDLKAFDRAKLQSDPCDFILVPGFVTPEAIDAINADYPAITRAGNFPPEELSPGPAFQAMLDQLNAPELKERFAEKFGMDLSDCPMQLTVRKYAEASDGNVHNDSSSKFLTVLIYLNKEWHAPGGQLRLLRDPANIEDYVVEVPPVNGAMLAFRRNERSFHGFPAYIGERRSVQFYWVKPKRAERGEKPFRIKRWLKRLRKIRKR
ncbi:2OG-Fe(II) oxygenase [Dongia soli]|uniref:2OG-Fe(II) oxygenase n=1 Tax=Dongia soli TaxID=600628 RepID=A0ABU5EGQ7_9PROT|nr:2OG-Fe(II) oxygenase [Dongia soli]MDY0885199.1 2OG-Fe(II) oxygenase [Dongia soli]